MPDRGGEAKPRGLFPWGDELEPHRMNIWQGHFPHLNTAEDGCTHVSQVLTMIVVTSL